MTQPKSYPEQTEVTLLGRRLAVLDLTYPGLDGEASRWILDQGVVNVVTDAVSTDNPLT